MRKNSKRASLFCLSLFLMAGCKESQMTSDATQAATTDNSSGKSEHSLSAFPSSDLVATWVDTHILAPEKMSLVENKTNYLFNSADLNNDGKAETLVMMQDQYFCGSGGCIAFLFNDKGEQINRFSVFNEPVFLSETRSHGWKDIVVRSGDDLHTLAFDGKKYPSNPSVAPVVNRQSDEEKAKELVMKTELYLQDGHDISPYFVGELLMPMKTFYFSFKHHGEPEKTFIAKVNLTTTKVEIESK